MRRCYLKGLVAGLLVLTGCAHRGAGGLLPVRLAVGGQAQLIYLAATLAQDLGDYREQGLVVTLQDFPGGAKSLEALLGGSTDVVAGFYDHTIQMAAQGRDVRAFLSVLRYPGLVAVAASPRISKIEDLKSRIVGVSAAGSSTNMFLNYLLAMHGMKPQDVSIASIGMSATAVAAVTHRRVDAAIMTDPALEIVRKQAPGVKILADTRTAEGVRQVFGVDAYPSVVLYSTGAWLDAHPEQARRMARALLQTMDWMRAHSPAEIREKMPAQFRTADAAADIEGLQSLKEMLSADGKLNLESAAVVRKVLSASMEGVRMAHIDLAKTYTNQFVAR